LFPSPLNSLTAGGVECGGIVVPHVIGEIAVVNEVSVVSIGRVVLAAASDGLVLTAGFAPEDGAETAVSEEKMMLTAFAFA
jgi:hypothetical protein